MGEKVSWAESLASLMILVAVGVQTWVVVQDATDGDAGRQVRRWWEGRARPQVDRLVSWVYAHDICEQMIIREIEPMLAREATL